MGNRQNANWQPCYAALAFLLTHKHQKAALPNNCAVLLKRPFKLSILKLLTSNDCAFTIFDFNYQGCKILFYTTSSFKTLFLKVFIMMGYFFTSQAR